MKRFLVCCLLFNYLDLSAQFSPGNIVVLRVGDGTTLSNAATQVFLDEYTPSGGFVSSTPIPIITVGSNKRLTQSGSSTAEGFLSLSELGNYLTFAGYDQASGVSNVENSTVDGVIAKVDKNKVVNTTNTFLRTGGNAYSNNNFRAVTSKTGQEFWLSGNGGGVYYYQEGVGMVGQMSTSVINTRATRIFNERLFISSNSGSFRICQVGSGVAPVGAPNTISNLPGMSASATDPMEFILLDADPAVVGYDLLYYTSIGSGPGIYKYSFDGTNWMARGSISQACDGLIARFNCAGAVDLFVTKLNGGVTKSNQTQLYHLTDNAAYNASISGDGSTIAAVGTLIATAPTNTAFCGLAFTPSEGVVIAGTQNIAPGDYNTIYIENGGTATLTGNITVYDKIIIKSGGTLVTNNFVISSPTGSGSMFELQSNGLLKIGSPDGISASGATGNIQTCIRRFNSGGRYEYNGFTPQTSGNGLPTTISGSLRVNKFGPSNDLTLSTPTLITGSLALESGKIITTATNLLTMADNATFASVPTSGSIVSFVAGPMKKTGDEDFVFPIGTGGIYAPLSITGGTGATATDEFTAEYIRANPQGAYPSGGSFYAAGIDHISYAEYWMLNRNAGTASKRVTLDVHATSFCQVINNTFVSRWSGTQWTNEASTATFTGSSGINQLGTVTTVAPITSFSPFTLATDLPSTSNALPVQLLTFNAQKRSSSQSYVYWELGVCCSPDAEFDVQRSNDAGRSFRTLATQPGSETEKKYEYLDNQLAGGVNYYRLKITDADGSISYSNTVAIYNGVEGLLLTSLRPTIVTNTTVLTVSASRSQKMELMMIDMSGRIVQRMPQSLQAGTTTITIDGSRLPAGAYQLLGITTEGKTNPVRFVKQ